MGEGKMLVQVALALLLISAVVIGVLYALDWAMEQIDDHIVRERIWREIDARSARESHPSSRGERS